MSGKIEVVHFRSILTDHQKIQLSGQQQNDWLMRQAAEALVREILKLDGAIEIQSQYNIATLTTEVDHKVHIFIPSDDRRVQYVTK